MNVRIKNKIALLFKIAGRGDLTQFPTTLYVQSRRFVYCFQIDFLCVSI